MQWCICRVVMFGYLAWEAYRRVSTWFSKDDTSKRQLMLTSQQRQLTNGRQHETALAEPDPRTVAPCTAEGTTIPARLAVHQLNDAMLARQFRALVNVCLPLVMRSTVVNMSPCIHMSDHGCCHCWSTAAAGGLAQCAHTDLVL
jgi:hypothetical protein